jgi:HAD superfamily hydrolase (TIGR01484 family)
VIMGKIKLVLTDIDGTIVSLGLHDPTPAVRQAIKDVQDAGIQLTAATGRPYEMTKDLFDDLGLKGLSIFDGGATIRDIQTGEFAWQNWLEVDRLKAIANILLPYSTLIDFFPTFHEVLPEDTSTNDIIEQAPYVFAFVRAAHRKEVEYRLSELSDLSVHIGPERKDMPGVFDIQITDVLSDKFHATNALRKIVHSSKAETLAIGDSTNDLPLFRNAGVKVAMGNAMDELKVKADYIVSALDKDGFAEAMHRFVLTS